MPSDWPHSHLSPTPVPPVTAIWPYHPTLAWQECSMHDTHVASPNSLWVPLWTTQARSCLCHPEVFWLKKYLWPMTLSGALSEDLVALQASFHHLLPCLVLSGRQMLFWEPQHHTREGYVGEFGKYSPTYHLSWAFIWSVHQTYDPSFWRYRLPDTWSSLCQKTILILTVLASFLFCGVQIGPFGTLIANLMQKCSSRTKTAFKSMSLPTQAWHPTD